MKVSGPDTAPEAFEETGTSLEALPHALELMTRAEIDMQVATAKRHPRPALSVIIQQMKSYALLDEETAMSCFYTLKRDGKAIRGPSVRLAEIAVLCFGNIRAGSRVIANDGRKITSQGMCHDLQNNTMISMEVQRRIVDRKGRTYSDDMQIVTGNAANAIAFRNAAFKIVPGALVKVVYDAAREAAVGNITTLSEKREKIFARFAQMGVERDRVLAAVDKPTIEDVDLATLEILIGIGTAIKDGDTTLDEAFPARRDAESEAPRPRLRDRIMAQQQPEAEPQQQESPLPDESDD